VSGLVLKLSPKERLLVNGAVIENGNRRSRLSILTSNAKILRLRDAIHPEEARTPVRRVCYSVQLILSGDTSVADGKIMVIRQLEELGQVFTDSDSRLSLSEANRALLEGHHYKCLKYLRSLLQREEILFSASGV